MSVPIDPAWTFEFVVGVGGVVETHGLVTVLYGVVSVVVDEVVVVLLEVEGLGTCTLFTWAPSVKPTTIFI